MAFYSPDDEENQDPNAPQAQGPEAGGAFIDGQGSAGAASAQAGAAASPANKPDNPGNFVGIKNYLDQNKGQAAKLARSVGGVVKGQGMEANNALGQAQGQFTQDVQKNTVGLDQGLLNQATLDPTKVANDSAQKDSILKMRDAEYKGPKALDGSVDYFNPVMNAVSKARQSAANTATVQGRNALLTDVQNQNKNRSTAGAATLDSAILGTSADAKKTLGRARESVAGVDQNLQKAQQDAANAATQAAATTTGTRDAARESLNKAFGDFTGGLAARQKDVSGQQQASYDALLKDLEDGKPSPQNLANFGIKTGDQLWGTNLNDPSLITRAPDADIGSVANADEYAKYAALAGLSGTDPGLLKQADIGKAGTASNVGFNVNTKALQESLAQKKQDYEQVVPQNLQKTFKPGLEKLKTLKNNWQRFRPSIITAIPFRL